MNRTFWENLVSLCGVHLLNYIMPLVTLPLLARVLGPSHWGQLAFAEAYAMYLSLFIEYGFGLSATRELAQLRDDAAARSRLLSGVLGAQSLMVLGAFAVTVALGFAAPRFAAYRSLLPLAFCLGVLRAVNPFWYFQGIERMRVVSMLSMATNVAAAFGILLFVRSPQDVWIPLALRTGAAFICVLFGFLLAYQNTPFSPPALRGSLSALRTGWSLFVMKGALSLYTTANVVVLGMLAAPSVVALYAGAEKIASAATLGLSPITQAFYPRISYLFVTDRRNASRTARASLLMTAGSGLALGLVLLFGAPLLVKILLGTRFSEAVPVLRVFCVLPPVVAVSSVLGIQWMLPQRLDKQLNWSIIGSGIVNILLALVLVPRFAQLGMATSVAVAETTVTAVIIVLLKYYRLDPWAEEVQEEVAAA